MAVRKNLSHPEKVRQRIKTSQLVNRLTNHALDNPEKPKYPMLDSQVRAALGLLKKVQPDLSNLEISGELETRSVVSAKPLTPEQWEKRYGKGGKAG